MACQNQSGEIADAIGWRGGVSILVECKASLADFRADQKKVFRKHPKLGMGDWRVYLCEKDVIQPEMLPEGWGLAWVCGSRVRRMAGLPKSNIWSPSPFASSKQSEVYLLTSALRRAA